MPPRIVVIEDEEDLAATLQWRLGRAGYDVEVAHDGQTGLEAVRRAPPALVLLDLMLPDTSGVKVCRKIKRDPATEAVRVLVLTARTGKADHDKVSRAGADGLMMKPFTFDALLARVGELVG